MTEEKTKLLSEIPAGQTVKFVKVDAGQGLNSRLASMGLVPNVEIKVINNSHPGPFVINVKNSRIALGRGMANKIKVMNTA